MTDILRRENSLLQDGVSFAAATLFAIEASGMLKALPTEEHERDQHNHGCALLAMLGDHLRLIQAQVDALEPATTPKVEG